PKGRVLAALALNEAGALDVALPRTAPATVYARTGDWPVTVLLAALIIAGLIRRRRELN
ncbi:MAG: apolipoprotein N-acyltransferase, partial [Shimia sp.]|nr:apolipoprotein N-acyltransferase [Shimia sp.]